MHSCDWVFLLSLCLDSGNGLTHVAVGTQDNANNVGFRRHESRVDRQRLVAVARPASVPLLVHGMPGRCSHARAPHQKRPPNASENGRQLPQVTKFELSKPLRRCEMHFCCRASLQYGVMCLKKLNYDRKLLDERRAACETGDKGANPIFINEH